MSYKGNKDFTVENYQEELERVAAENENGRYPPSIFIGLGGTGQKALLHLRTRFFERFNKPVLNGMAFLVFDTDVSDQKKGQGYRATPFDKQVDYKEQEQLHISAPVEHILKDLSKYPEVQEWMDPNMKVEESFDISTGAGQMRPISRLVGLRMKDDICSRLSQAEAQIRDNAIIDPRLMTDKPTDVYIVAGLAGGTGSGLFLDVAAMVRSTLQNEMNVKAFLVLPDCYVKVEKSYPKPAANGAAALRELNHFLVRPYPLPWKKGEVLKKQLFNQVFLFGGTNMDGKVISDPNDPYMAIGEALFMRYSTGGLPGFINSVYVNRVQYLQNDVKFVYTTRDEEDPSKKEETKATSWKQSLSSFGIGKLTFPAWRLMHYARYDLALQMMAVLNPEERMGQAAVGIWRDQFLYKWGILHGEVKCEEERFKEEFAIGKHWLVRDALNALPGAESPDIKRGIKSIADKLIQRAPAIFEEKKTKQQIMRIEQQIDGLLGSPDVKNSAGEWAEQIWKNSKILQTNLRDELNNTIEWFYSQYGLNGVSSIIEDSISLLKKDGKAAGAYITGMEQKKMTEAARAKKIKEEYDQAILVAIDSEKGILGFDAGRDPEVHLKALNKFGEYFAKYWGSRFKSLIAEECANVFRFALELLNEKKQEIKEINDTITEYQIEFENWKRHFAKPIQATTFKELDAPPLHKLLEPYLGTGQKQKETLRRFVEVSLESKSVNVRSYGDLVHALLKNKESFKEKLLLHLYKSLLGKSVGGSSRYTKAFDVMGEVREENYLGESGFIEYWSIENLLKNDNALSTIKEKSKALFEYGRAWIKKVSGGQVPGTHAYRSHSDIFVSLPGKVSDSGERALKRLEDSIEEVATEEGLSVKFIRDGDPSEIVLYSEEHAFPIFHHTGIHSNNGLLYHYEKLLFEETNKTPLHLFRDYHTFDPLKPVTSQEQEHIIKTLRVLYKAQFHGLIQSKPQTIIEQQQSYPLARYTYALIQESKGTTQDKNIGVEDQIIRDYKNNTKLLELENLCDIKEEEFIQSEKGNYEYLYTLADYWIQVLYPVRKDLNQGTQGDLPYGSLQNLALDRLRSEYKDKIFKREDYQIVNNPQQMLNDAVYSNLKRITQWTRPVAAKVGYPMVKKTPLHEEAYLWKWNRSGKNLLKIVKDSAEHYLNHPIESTQKWFNKRFISKHDYTLPGLALNKKFFAPVAYNVKRPNYPEMIARSKSNIFEELEQYLDHELYTISDLAQITVCKLNRDHREIEKEVLLFKHPDFQEGCIKRGWIIKKPVLVNPPPPELETIYHYAGPSGQSELSVSEIVEKIQAKPNAKHKVWKKGFSGWKIATDVEEIAAQIPPEPSETIYHYAGPSGQSELSVSEIVEKIQAKPNAKHQVWKKGFSGWKIATDVEEIAAQIPPSLDEGPPPLDDGPPPLDDGPPPLDDGPPSL